MGGDFCDHHLRVPAEDEFFVVCISIIVSVKICCNFLYIYEATHKTEVNPFVFFFCKKTII